MPDIEDEDLSLPPTDGDAKPAKREEEPATETAVAKTAETEEIEPAEGLEPPEERKPGSKRKTVPYDAMFEERERRKQAEIELREIRENYARLEERTNLLLKRVEPKPDTPAPPPNFEDDVFAAANYDRDRLNKLENMASQFETQQQQQQQMQQLVSAYRADAEAFKTSNPDFMDAYNTYRNARWKEYETLGFQAAQIAQAMEQEELNLAYSAFQNRRSPSQTIYEMAKLRGYQAKQAPSQPRDGVNEVQRIARAADAAASLSAAGGGAVAGNGKIDVKTLASMSASEFSKWYAKYGEEGLAKAHGL